MDRDPAVEVQLASVVDGLVNHTQGAIPRSELAALVDRLYDEMAATSTIQTFLPVLVGRAALAKVQDGLPAAQAALADQPEVLIVCQENAGRSQAAAALFRHYAPGVLRVESAGMAPADHIQPAVVDALAAHGVHLTDGAKLLEPQMLQRAAHVVVIGETGIDGERWDLPDLQIVPAGELPEVLIAIDDLVRESLQRWFPDVTLGEPVMRGAVDPV